MGATAIESQPIHASYGGDALPSTVIQAIEAMTLGNNPKHFQYMEAMGTTPIKSNLWELWWSLQSSAIYSVQI